METTNVEEAVKTSEAVTKEVPKVIDKALEGLKSEVKTNEFCRSVICITKRA